MKKLFAILSFFSISVAKADFVPIDFISLIHRADKIASGEIICVDENVFELMVGRSLTSKDKVITINKFEDWTCAVRWSDYFVGQKIMVFLSDDKDGLHPIGSGNEGELPILESKVYPSLMSWHFDYGAIKKIKPLPEYKKFDSEIYTGIELELDFLWEYVKTIRECFKSELAHFSRVKSAEWTCSPEKAEKLKNSNKLYAQTFKKLIKNANTVYN